MIPTKYLWVDTPHTRVAASASISPYLHVITKDPTSKTQIRLSLNAISLISILACIRILFFGTSASSRHAQHVCRAGQGRAGCLAPGFRPSSADKSQALSRVHPCVPGHLIQGPCPQPTLKCLAPSPTPRQRADGGRHARRGRGAASSAKSRKQEQDVTGAAVPASRPWNHESTVHCGGINKVCTDGPFFFFMPRNFQPGESGARASAM